MTNFNDIKGFIFDLDGVIALTSKYHSQAWHQIADDLGVTWTKSLEDGLKGISRMDSLEMILKAGNKENDYTEEEKIKLAAKKNDNYLALIGNMNIDDLLPGIPEFLEDLMAHNYKICLASASKNSPIILKKLNLARYFPDVVDPSKLKKGKPDPEIYIRGAELLNLKPEECIGIEDAAAGIQSINGAGETSIGIGDTQELSAADILFSSTKDITLANIEAAMKVNA
ncbi:beta-phosphoglucomutase [Sporolactobacillus sp. CPB3-1]|uniref:Beta-phosphoglucomutase n=1 Tax=Sporolactobacillus mangiferae TaxID=2940498 RepID=A0ABT0M983_9BACL|nr:beta-phosphoglucomutase [Sporolactobacillus mangiferae]MCL1631446.1 beta-phosphoglucomutase [Sporolactobacillus mangiferae]